jgi:hypothetical protein
MKKLILLICCFFWREILLACGWMPYSETDYRLFNPELLGNAFYKPYIYSWDAFDYDKMVPENARKEADKKNIQEWINYIGFTGNSNAIDEILNATPPDYFADSNGNIEQGLFQKNAFLKFLLQNKRQDVINYLVFAKKCEKLNSDKRDPWQEPIESAIFYPHLLREAENFCNTTKDKFLQKRYAFQLIRLSRYYQDIETGQKFYNQYFASDDSESVLKYWAMMYYAFITPDEGYGNYLLSKVFEKAPDKRNTAFHYFNPKTIEKALPFAKNVHEQANILVLKSLNNPGPSLSEIQRIYEIDPASEMLCFLMIREINKLEAWILTARYTEIDSYSGHNEIIYDDDDFNEKETIAHPEKDELYLKEYLEFAENCLKTPKMTNISLWSLMTAYLANMNRQYEKSAQYLNKVLTSKGLTDKIEAQIHLILLISELRPEKIIDAKQDQFLLNEMQWLEHNKNKVYKYRITFNKLMMALTNRYQVAGNITRATLCHLKVFDYMRWGRGYSKKDYYEYNEEENESIRMNFNSSYIFFLEKNASIKDIEHLRLFLEKPDKTPFEKYLAKECLADKNRILDLLGIKYLRENDLYNARRVFKDVSNDFWFSDKESYKTYLNANPFYTNFSQEHKKSKADIIRFTKYTLTDSLIKVIERADNPKEPNRAKWYFLAGNCYFNMTYWGNSWIMTRYWASSSDWSEYGNKQVYTEDEKDYYYCRRAKTYYEKASRAAKNSHAALSMGMMARCERYFMIVEGSVKDSIYDYKAGKTVKNPHYRLNPYFLQLKQKYPQHYDLIYQCSSFEEFYSHL